MSKTVKNYIKDVWSSLAFYDMIYFLSDDSANIVSNKGLFVLGNDELMERVESEISKVDDQPNEIPTSQIIVDIE